MDGLELHVRRSDPHEGRERLLGVEILLQIAQQRRDFFGRRRNERRIAGAGAANPVLAAAYLARLLVGAANAAHESAVRLVEEAHRERQTLWARELATRVLERVEVVADLAHVLERLAIGLLSLVLEQIDERRLRAL